MNFVAHAVVAAGEGSTPYVFGAMVPDLRPFAGVEDLAPPSRDRQHVDAGIRSHHRVDGTFHADPRFKAWMAEVSAPMGDTRAARAAAHVAVELAMDGQLLGAGRAEPFYDALSWARGVLSGSWLAMIDRLASDELVSAYCTPDGVAQRTVRAISRRPRLSRLDLDVDALTRAIADAAPSIARELDDVIASAAAQDDRQHQ